MNCIIQSKQSDIERAICEGKTAEIESRICIYNGQLKTEHNSLQIDAAIATDEVQGVAVRPLTKVLILGTS